MPRPKKPPATPPAKSAIVPPSKTSHLFGPKPAGKSSVLTHERLAQDLAAFQDAGGKIEVLGITRSTPPAKPDAPPPPAPARSRR